MSDDEHVLSPYEHLRLDRIRSNAARLAELGLDCSIAALTGRKKPKNEAQRTRKRPRLPKEKRAPTRCSKRLRKLEADSSVSSREEIGPSHAEPQDAEEDGNKMDYARWPQEPEQLDDDEFEVFVSVRKWRLQRKNELEVEAYKICQNRTICELIRRVRNGPSWGASRGPDGKARGDDDAAKDLIECWGLGPWKVAADGYGPGMMAVLEEEENQRLLEVSRRRIASVGKVKTAKTDHLSLKKGAGNITS